MKSLMIDLESLSTSEDAVLVQIAWIVFDSETFQILSTYNVFPELERQIMNGRRIDASTLKWWMKQNQEARAIFDSSHASSTPMEVGQALGECFDKHDIKEVWAMGPLFDIAALASFLGGHHQALFHYGSIRDVRTVREIARADGVNLDEVYARIPSGVGHDALDDCRWQVSLLKELKAERGKQC